MRQSDFTAERKKALDLSKFNNLDQMNIQCTLGIANEGCLCATQGNFSHATRN